MRIYVAGPYTAPDCVENTHRAIAAGDALLALGHAPYVPHLNLAWHLVRPHPPETWYALDLVWLAQCDALLRLPGASKGADAEVTEAFRLGLPVYLSLEEIPPPPRRIERLCDRPHAFQRRPGGNYGVCECGGVLEYWAHGGSTLASEIRA